MTNSISTSSVATMATSMFGSARDAFKAMADAATPADTARPAAAEGAKKGRLGTVLDCYA